MVKGIDTSFANEPINWLVVLEEDLLGFIYHRATYGADPSDDDGKSFIRAHNACKSYKMPFGAYHFFVMTDDPVAQAQNFLAATDGYLGTLLPMVDVEEESFKGDDSSVEQRIHAIDQCLTTTANAIKARPIIYTNLDTWQNYLGGTDAFSGHPFWVAQYGVEPGKFDPIPGIPRGAVVIHQYTDRLQLPGIPTNVDGDVLLLENVNGILRPLS